MAGDVKVGVVNALLSGTAGGSTDFTISGFGTPKACIVITAFDSTDNTAVSADARASIGFSDFTNHFCISHQDEDASAKSDCDRRKSNTVCYAIMDTAGSVAYSGTASTVTDGVKLTNTSGEAAGRYATVIMFGGTDLNVAVGSAATPNGVPSTTVVTTSIDQSLVFFIGADVSGEDSSTSGIVNSFGVATINAAHDTFVNRALSWTSNHNNTNGAPFSYISTSRCLKMISQSAAEDWSLDVTAASSTTFTVTENDATSGANMEFYYLALDLARGAADEVASKIGSVDSPTSGTSWTPSVSLGFTPQFVMLGLTASTVENSIRSNAEAGSIGISANTGSGEEGCNSWYNEQAAPTTNTNSLHRSRVIDFRDDDVTTVLADMSHSSFNSGDWTYTINTENITTALKWLYVAIEDPTAGGSHTGTGAPSLAAITATAVGEQPHEGVSDIALEASALAAVGVMHAEGTGAPALEQNVLTAAGVQKHLGTSDLAMEQEVLTAAGVMVPAGQGDLTLEIAELASAGLQSFLGVTDALLQSVAMTAAGVMLPKGVGALALEIAELAATGQVPYQGVGALIAQDALLSAAGSVPQEGTGAPLLQQLAQVSSGVMLPTGQGLTILQAAELNAAGVEILVGVGAAELQSALLVAAGEMPFKGVSDLVLNPGVLTAAGVMVPAGQGAAILESQVLVSSGIETILGVGSLGLAAQELVSQGLLVPDGVGNAILEPAVLTAVGATGNPEGVGALLMLIAELQSQGLLVPAGIGSLLVDVALLDTSGVGGPTPTIFPYKPLRRPRRL